MLSQRFLSYCQLRSKCFCQRRYFKTFLLGKKNKPFKKILKSIIPKMDPSGRPATISDHEIWLLHIGGLGKRPVR